MTAIAAVATHGEGAEAADVRTTTAAERCRDASKDRFKNSRSPRPAQMALSCDLPDEFAFGHGTASGLLERLPERDCGGHALFLRHFLHPLAGSGSEAAEDAEVLSLDLARGQRLRAERLPAGSRGRPLLGR